MFENGVHIGDGANRNSMLWEPHLYTIRFEYLFITRSCPLVFSYFVNQVYELMKINKPKPIYGKLGYSIIKTKESIRKHLYDIDNWEFYYEDGDLYVAIFFTIWSGLDYFLKARKSTKLKLE